jgi:predicted ribosome quality control (RQC) complex YloA/Tae2 family protein
MLRQYYTLEKIVEKLKFLVGFQLCDCFTQDRNSLLLEFSDDVSVHHIQLFLSTAYDAVLLRDNFARARANTVNLFPSMIGETLQDIVLSPDDRIITMEFINSKMHIVLFGGSRSSVIAVNSDDIIIDSFKSRGLETGSRYSMPEPNAMKLADYPEDTKIVDALGRCDMLIGKPYAREICARTEIEQNRQLSDLSVSELDMISTASIAFRKECAQTEEFFIYENNDGTEVLSFVSLSGKGEPIHIFDSVHKAVYHRVVNALKSSGFLPRYKNILKQLERKQHKLTRNLELPQDEQKHEERINKYKMWAELLISQPDQRRKPGESIELMSWEGNMLTVPLDKKKNISENSRHYFDKVKAQKEAANIRKKRRPKIKAELKEVTEALANLEAISENRRGKELDKLEKSIRHLLNIPMKYEDKTPAEKFKTFDLGEGYTLYVGKNSANNDELTMKFAKPNDLWFHARGSSGSHAVLPFQGSKNPHKQIIKKEDSIAAYYSKSKNAKYTPVAYTYKKYVRKPKGAAVGSVVIAREEVVMVEPKLPAEG